MIKTLSDGVPACLTRTSTKDLLAAQVTLLRNVRILYALLGFVIFPALLLALSCLFSLPLALLGLAQDGSWSFEHAFFTVAGELSASHVGLVPHTEFPDGVAPRITVIVASTLTVPIFAVLISVLGGPALSLFLQKCELAAASGGPLGLPSVSRKMSVVFIIAVLPLICFTLAVPFGMLLGSAHNLSLEDALFLAFAQTSSTSHSLLEHTAVPVATAWRKLVLVLLSSWSLSLQAIAVAIFGGPTLKYADKVKSRLAQHWRLCLIVLAGAVLPVACGLLALCFALALHPFEPGAVFLSSFMAILTTLTTTGSGFSPLLIYEHRVAKLILMFSSLCRWCIVAQTITLLGRVLSTPFVQKFQDYWSPGYPTRMAQRRVARFLACIWPIVAIVLSAALGTALAAVEGWPASQGIYAELTEMFGTQMQLADWGLVSAFQMPKTAHAFLALGGLWGLILRCTVIGAVVQHVVIPHLMGVEEQVSSISETASPSQRTSDDPAVGDGAELELPMGERPSFVQFLKGLDREAEQPVMFETDGAGFSKVRNSATGGAPDVLRLRAITEDTTASEEWQSPAAAGDEILQEKVVDKLREIQVRQVAEQMITAVPEAYARPEDVLLQVPTDTAATGNTKEWSKDSTELRPLPDPATLDLEEGSVRQDSQPTNVLEEAKADQISKESMISPEATRVSLDSELVRNWFQEHTEAASSLRAAPSQ